MAKDRLSAEIERPPLRGDGLKIWGEINRIHTWHACNQSIIGYNYYSNSDAAGRIPLPARHCHNELLCAVIDAGVTGQGREETGSS